MLVQLLSRAGVQILDVPPGLSTIRIAVKDRLRYAYAPDLDVPKHLPRRDRVFRRRDRHTYEEIE